MDLDARIEVRLSKASKERVQEIARLMGVRERRNISACEAVRMAIDTCYPIPPKPKQEKLPLFDEE